MTFFLVIRRFGNLDRSFGRTDSAEIDRSFGRSFGFGRTLLEITNKKLFVLILKKAYHVKNRSVHVNKT